LCICVLLVVMIKLFVYYLFVVTGISKMSNMKSAHTYYKGIWTNSNAHMHTKRLRVTYEKKYMCIYNMYIERSSLIAIIIISAHMYNRYIVISFSFRHLYNVYVIDFKLWILKNCTSKHIILEKHICNSLLENANVEKKTKK
jgi:hypothetical protein